AKDRDCSTFLGGPLRKPADEIVDRRSLPRVSYRECANKVLRAFVPGRAGLTRPTSKASISHRPCVMPAPRCRLPLFRLGPMRQSAGPRARSAFPNHQFGRELYFPFGGQVAVNQLQEQFSSPFTDLSSCLPHSCYGRDVSPSEFDVVEASNRNITRNGNASCGQTAYQPHRHFIVARKDGVRKVELR